MKYSLILLALFLGACSAESLPANFAPGEECLLATSTPLEPTEDDPHEGVKNVYYCGVDESMLLEDGTPRLPYPDGTQIIKISTRHGQDYPWLVAEMLKVDGTWSWVEYTRNFADEEYVEIPVSKEVCTDCHQDARDSDWVFTIYTGR